MIGAEGPQFGGIGVVFAQHTHSTTVLLAGEAHHVAPTPDHPPGAEVRALGKPGRYVGQHPGKTKPTQGRVPLTVAEWRDARAGR